MINYQPQASWYSIAHIAARACRHSESQLCSLTSLGADHGNPEREIFTRENEQMLWIGCLQSSHAFLLGGMRERICSVGLLSPPMNLHLRHHHCVFASLSIEDEIDDDEEEDWSAIELTEEEELWAKQLEEQLVADQFSRAAMEQNYLGPGDPLPLSNSAAEAIEACINCGVARLASGLQPETAAALRAHVLQEISKERKLEDGVEAGRLSKVIAPTAASGSSTATRWDLRLPMNVYVRRALREMLCGDEAALGEALEAAAGGREAELWELGALVSAPGAAAQIVHADVVWRPKPSLHTAFVALQPICRTLGPTRFFPSTHENADLHAAHVSHGDATALTAGGQRPGEGPPLPSQVALLAPGEVALYDARCFHCGGANTYGGGAEGIEDANSDGLRVLFYLTTRHADRAAEPAVHDPARSLLASLDGVFTLGMLRDGEHQIDEVRRAKRLLELQRSEAG